MNHRRALRAATDAGLGIFGIMTVGVVLWTADEVLGWNVLPDWIDAAAQALVIILSILAAFAVVISIMCSFAVMAEAAADRAGLAAPRASTRTRALLVLGILGAVAIMAGLNKLSEHREAKRIQASRDKDRHAYFRNQGLLRDRLPGVLERFNDALTAALDERGTPAGDEAVAGLLNAARASTPLAPGVSVLVHASAPYSYCVLTAHPHPQREADGRVDFLKREYLIDLPSVWERDTVAALFDGATLTVPHGRGGAFIDTKNPCAWGFVRRDGTVIAIVMLRMP
ncbi:MAG: hypothetical protein O3B24_02995 [Verrucomicrobia bacterium]|nr:hypothetical protein [Verrucomicrobiota bacterium]